MPKIKGESSLYAWNDKLSEPTYNNRFIALMDQFMPKWRFYRDG
jgi:hypothetical protein